MKLNILCDAFWESRIDKVLDELSDTNYRRLFEERDYGNGLNGIVVIFICQDSSLHLKKRVRFSRKEKTIYLDIMLDLEQMKQAQQEVRKRIAVEKLAEEIPSILGKYSIPDFNQVKFINDLMTWLKGIGR